MKKLLLALMLLFTSVYLSAQNVGPKQILETLQRFYSNFKGANELVQKANGYLVFPNVYKAGLVIGGEYGEGALIEQGSIISYYRLYSTSVGLQAGAQRRSVIILFLTKEALNNFINKQKWEVGVDGSIALVKWSRGTDLSTISITKDTIAVVFNDIGIMANLSLSGTVFQRIR